MAKRARGANAGSTGAGVTPAAAAAPTRFADLDAQARALREAGDKPGLFAPASNTQPAAVTGAPSAVNLELWLARLRVEGLLTQQPENGRIWVKEEQREPLTPVLDRIAALLGDDFPSSPEFELFLQVHRHGPKGALAKYDWLVKACRARPDRHDFLDTLRGAVLALQDQDGYEDEDKVDVDLVEQLGDTTAVLTELIDTALQGASLEEDRLRLQVYRIDLEFRTAEPWDYAPTAQRARRLGSPRGEPTGGTVTPDSWAFLWQLRWMPAEGFADFLRDYAPGDFYTRTARGLYLVMRSLVEPVNEEDLIQGLSLLAIARDSSDSDMLGSSILVQPADDAITVPIGWQDLDVPVTSSLLLHLVEAIPREHPDADRLLAAYHVWAAGERYDQMEPAALARVPQAALDWLCDTIPYFLGQLADAHPQAGVRLQLLLREVLNRARDPGLDRHLSAEVDDEAKLTKAQRSSCLVSLRGISVYAGAMPQRLERQWRRIVGPALWAVTTGADAGEREEIIDVARDFEGDLAAAKDLSSLAYLEHVAGEPEEAVRLYAEMIANEEQTPDWALKNLRILVNASKDEETAKTILEATEAIDWPPSRAAHKRELLAAARAKVQSFEEQEQFERTALARWPSLTAPARKLLTVLAAVRSYQDLEELGRYANMELDWVERHYRKLVDTGMVFRRDGKFWINKHILPLIERENQHAVVGRIIRTNGTSAVKQVFNSAKEFSIYQIMVQLCPNHLVFPNCGLQSFMQFDRMKELVEQEDFGYYLRASVDILIVSSTTFLPMLAIEVDSAWHDTDNQQIRDERKDRLFAAAGVPFLRLRQLGSPSEQVIRGQVADHLQELVRTLRTDLPGHEQARELLVDLSRAAGAPGGLQVPLRPAP